MQDVAQAAGVSVSTVSRALRGSSKVRPSTIAAVRAAAYSLGFVASPSASSLATGKVRRVAVLIGAPLTDWFSGSILDGIYDVLREAGLDLLLYRVHNRSERDEFFRILPARRNADALIVASFALSEEEERILDDSETPVVFLSQRVAGHASVGVDDAGDGRTAARLLLNLGHTRFAYLRNSLDLGFRWSARGRHDGWTRELDDASVTQEARVDIDLPVGPDFGEKAAARLLAGPLPVAVTAENDDLALRLLIALERIGARVPQDIAIVGFDGQPRALEFGITTVAQPVHDMARLAAEAATALALGATVDWHALPDDAVELPTTLLLGRTTQAIART
ncbi:LacI family DNA-binding transcriptional regulator [Frigoribacterium sp. 2-23]|uniref:LacI family DNA-binding transcriptional regulator n=1 Tax=Frigoribacterium sp. 2-23 TaxID=3415006 RepID=UPI003C6F275D